MFSSFNAFAGLATDPSVQQTTAKCLEQLQCAVDSEMLHSAYVLVCFPERIDASVKGLVAVAHPFLGAFELACAVGSGTDNLNAASVEYVRGFEAWRTSCVERYGFWVETCSSVRLVTELNVWNKTCCT
jgi:hypothetical protein